MSSNGFDLQSHANGHTNGATPRQDASGSSADPLRSHDLVRETATPALVGEVVEASTTEFLAQALQLDFAPPFGAFVQVDTDGPLTVYAVVALVQTSGIDPGSRAIMRGHDDVRDHRIYQENPDLPFVLRTTFRALIVGFSEPSDGRLLQFLPPRPPRLHYSVFTCPTQAVRVLTQRLDYLQALLNAADLPADELLAANLRYAAGCSDDPQAFLELAGRELAQLLRADYARLTAILRRCLLPAEVA
jgi:hypothetical protein